MSYYDQRKKFLTDLQDFVTENSGKEVALSALEYKFGLRYGFSRPTIVKGLKVYQDLGKVELVDEAVRIK